MLLNKNMTIDKKKKDDTWSKETSTILLRSQI